MSERPTNLFGERDPAIEVLRRNISVALSAMKSSIERGFTPRRITEDPEFAARWKDAVLKIEGARIEYNVIWRRPAPQNESRYLAALERLHENLASLTDNQEFMATISEVPFREMLISSREAEVIDPRLREGGLSVADALGVVLDLLDERERPASAASAEQVGQLRRLVPAQKIAPAQFDVRDGKLVVVDQAATPAVEDRENVASSREALLAGGDKLVQELERSNCDRRLLESVRELQEGLSSEQNVIKLGVMNLTCEALCDAFRAEMPDAICGMLQGHTRGVAMYVAQFPDWQRFSEKAAAIQLDAADIIRISATASALISELEANPRVADPAVPKTISALRAMLNNPGASGKRIAFAMLRTLENLVAKAFEYGAKLIDATANKTISDIASVASKLIVAGLLSIALSGATSLSPLADKVADTAWLRTAAELVRHQLAALKD